MTLNTDAMATATVRARFENAIAALLDKVKQDPYVLAVVLAGSLSYDVVWEKSDIDLMIVTQETKLKQGSMTLTEDGLIIHATLIPRVDFKRMLEGAVQSSFIHSMLMKGQLLYTRDETLENLWAAREQFGARDREIRLLQAATLLTMTLTKAQKWFHVKNDPLYSSYWILKGLDNLAVIETVLAGEITGREVVWQALRHNPEFFQAVYTDLLDGPKTHETVGAALARIETYLKERMPVICRPLLDYLAETDGVRSAREIDHHFHNQMNVEFAALLCEWLAAEGFIQQVAAPARLTDRSRIDVEEVAYYYDAGR
jgi:predicted nucleotidyltransferase